MASVCSARNRFPGFCGAVVPFCSWFSVGCFFPVFMWSSEVVFFPEFSWICFGATDFDALGEVLVEVDGVADMDGV
jgi:hypothetical protein